MGKIYLVRHGQASLGSTNYDQLSPLGIKQSFRLGEYFRACGVVFEAAYTGTLTRQQETLHQIQLGLQLKASNYTNEPALNEYDSHALISCVHKGPIPSPNTAQGYKEFFKLLRSGLLSWMTDQSTPESLPDFVTFQAKIIRTLQKIQTAHTGSVLIVSSGGPISTALAYLLGMSHEGRIELNLRLRNSSLSEISFSPKALAVISFNTLNHLAQPEFQDWVTYA